MPEALTIMKIVMKKMMTVIMKRMMTKEVAGVGMAIPADILRLQEEDGMRTTKIMTMKTDAPQGEVVVHHPVKDVDGMVIPRVILKHPAEDGKMMTMATVVGMAIRKVIRKPHVAAGKMKTTVTADGSAIRKAIRKQHAGAGKKVVHHAVVVQEGVTTMMREVAVEEVAVAEMGVVDGLVILKGTQKQQAGEEAVPVADHPMDVHQTEVHPVVHQVAVRAVDHPAEDHQEVAHAEVLHVEARQEEVHAEVLHAEVHPMEAAVVLPE